MKSKLLSIFVALSALVGCTDDAVLDEQLVQPAQTGEEIYFASPTLAQQEEVNSRTIYGKQNGPVFPINWVEGDQIAIFCPEASAPKDKIVWYNVSPNSSTPNVADALINVGQGAALQWGAEQTHRFYGFYPGDKVNSSHLQGGGLIGNIPTLQKPIKFLRRNEAGEIGSTGNTIIAQPDMSNAFMYAYTSHDKSQGNTVQLHYKPVVTALIITVNGPAEGSMTISKVEVSSHSKDGKTPMPITGDFLMKVVENGKHKGEIHCTAQGKGTVNNLITIPCYREVKVGDKTEKQFVTLNSGEQLKLVAFIAPDDKKELKNANLSVRVTEMNKTPLSKTFDGQLVPVRKATKVNLPKMISTEGNEWMKFLDDNIYLTELSLPGSKLSYATAANGAPIEYQISTLQEQYNTGVRAFIFQTGAVHKTRTEKVPNPDYNPDIWIPLPGFNPEFIDKEIDESYITVAIDAPGGKVKRFKPLKEVMQDLTNMVQGTQEYVFALITYSGGATDTPTGMRNEEFWIKTLEKELMSYKAADSPYAVYKEAVTANTTLGQLRGKILLKANYNNVYDGKQVIGNMSQYVTQTELPCMFTLWQRGYEPNGVDMQWGSPKNAAGLKWLYQERTDITDFAEKESNINTVFDLAVTKYNNPNYGHDTWFMNDLGGYDATDNKGTDAPAKLTTLQVATHFNQLAIDKLQTRTQNAALGLLYMNFAGMQPEYGQVCKSDWLIQTTIDNNFKFPLRVKSGGTSKASVSSTANTRAAEDEWDK